MTAPYCASGGCWMSSPFQFSQQAASIPRAYTFQYGGLLRVIPAPADALSGAHSDDRCNHNADHTYCEHDLPTGPVLELANCAEENQADRYYRQNRHQVFHVPKIWPSTIDTAERPDSSAELQNPEVSDTTDDPRCNAAGQKKTTRENGWFHKIRLLDQR